MAKVPYNKARRYDWKPLREEVFGKKTAQIPPEQRQSAGPTHAYIPPADENEFLERPATTLPVSPSVSGEEEDASRKVFQIVPPQKRVQKLVNGWAVGRGGRKTAESSVRIKKAKDGVGSLKINGKTLDIYFPLYTARELVLEPLLITETLCEFDIDAKVRGGGNSAQAGAVRLGLGRALQNYDPNFRWALKMAGCLERDSRIVERKKTGKPKARRAKQWSKR